MSGVEAMRVVRKPLFTRWASRIGWGAACLIFLVCAGTLGQASAGEEQYIKLSTPKLLIFDELVQLEKTDEPPAQLAARLDQLLHTPFVSNEAYFGGAKPNRPSSEELGPFIRATTWNIERGIEFDG